MKMNSAVLETTTSSHPDWIHEEALFIDILRQQMRDFKKITNFNVASALSGGENYLTKVSRIKINVELQDGSSRIVRYFVKLPLVSDKGDAHEFHELFMAEAEMYLKLIPELEQIYFDYANKLIVRFKPLNFEFSRQPPCDYILMEDLSAQGYRNLNRLTGLEQTEIEAVLNKLAQWHAASAKRVESRGPYSEIYEKSYFGEESRELLQDMNAAFSVPFLQCLEEYQLTKDQKKIIIDYNSRLTDLYFEFGKIDSSKFNVLNHGDFWCNNFMFRYDSSNLLIEDICFVDFQLPKYGSPAQDLLCLLITSPKMEIKLQKFDYFIEYYHEQLVRQLKLLDYQGSLPSREGLKENLKDKGLWGYVCAQRMLPVVLLPPSEDSHCENFLSDNEEGVAFKKRMLLNPSFIKQIELILPWLIEQKYIS